ncbi:restriction endonuclease subunit S [Enterococcus massiliensis]|uniref:restriction endonuclease subunit S n=1 Tax=Enterococcus massiliensis TaxID=1640685 RepID=UPI00065E5BD2|nr:restriction endonuclease subunit S [Enterococcus massiliensis]
MSNDIQPEIRFPGFTEDWEERKLSEMANFSKGNGYSKADLAEEGHPVILYGRLYTKYETIIENVDTFAELKEKSVISNGGEVIVPASGETPEDISRASVVDVSGVALGGDLNIIKTKSELDPIFLALTISNGSQQKEMTKRAQGKSVVHLHNSDLKEVNLLYPKLDEQVKIGSFFKKLDVSIALHQRKLDLLKETKKGFLQKMFPKNGAKVPEIRFPGFTKDWEERKLGDVFSERSERSSEGELISVTINSGVIKASELDRKDNSSDNKSNYKKVEVGDIAYNSMRMWQGASGYSSYEGILSPAYTVIIPKEGTDSKFFAYDFKRYDMIQTFKRNSQGLTSDTWNLKFPTLKLVKIMVPSIEEQKQIAAFFERLDNTIALHERELDVLKETKKGFLQKMFV